MDTCKHNFSTLFQQLGLENSEEAIKTFIMTHHITQYERLDQAKFWNKGQAQFLRESWEQDADWAEPIDQLDGMLRA